MKALQLKLGIPRFLEVPELGDQDFWFDRLGKYLVDPNAYLWEISGILSNENLVWWFLENPFHLQRIGIGGRYGVRAVYLGRRVT